MAQAFAATQVATIRDGTTAKRELPSGGYDNLTHYGIMSEPPMAATIRRGGNQAAFSISATSQQ